MRKTIVVLFLALLPKIGFSLDLDRFPPEMPQLRAACSDSIVRQQCQAACAQACFNNRDFKTKYWNYCISVLPPNTPKNDDACPSIMAGTLRDLPPDRPKPDDPCADVTELFEKIECQQKVSDRKVDDTDATRFPTCTPNVPTLIERANQLQDSINQKLSGYTGILEFDPDVVQTAEQLCGFSRDELSRFYRQATQDQDGFTSLQGQAKQIESCAADIEEWLQKAAEKDMERTTDALHDNLIRSTKKQLKKLVVPRERLIESTRKLKDVGPKILAIAKLYVRFCKGN